MNTELNMKHFQVCPNCAGEGTVALKNTMDTVEVRGEKFDVPVTFFACSRCHETFQPMEGDLGLPQARDLYRRRHGMVMPADLIAFRRSYELSQTDLATILGWGVATVSRYENGKLQEPAHDKVLHLVMQRPENLLELVECAEELAPDTKARLVTRLEEQVAAVATQNAFVRQAATVPGRQLDLKKLANLVAILCGKQGVFATKLNKLLFYTDFKAQKDLWRPISNLCYERLPYGPVPSKYRLLYAWLEQQGTLQAVEEVVGDVAGTRLMAVGEPDKNCFDEEELGIIFGIKRHFERTSASEISEISHRENAWLDTAPGALISYEHAKRLSI